jgi:hypothetical protein
VPSKLWHYYRKQKQENVCHFILYTIFHFHSSYEKDEHIPTHVLLSRFHLLLLDEMGLSLFDRFDKQRVGVIPWGNSSEATTITTLSLPQQRLLFGDGETFWLLLGSYHLYEILLVNDEAGVWKKFLKRECFESSLHYCPVSCSIFIIILIHSSSSLLICFL